MPSQRESSRCTTGSWSNLRIRHRGCLHQPTLLTWDTACFMLQLENQRQSAQDNHSPMEVAAIVIMNHRPTLCHDVILLTRVANLIHVTLVDDFLHLVLKRGRNQPTHRGPSSGQKSTAPSYLNNRCTHLVKIDPHGPISHHPFRLLLGGLPHHLAHILLNEDGPHLGQLSAVNLDPNDNQWYMDYMD